MDTTAFVYVPSECADYDTATSLHTSSSSSSSKRNSSCRIHVVYPGCFCSVATSPAGRPSTGMDIVEYGGFNDWAESNGIIVVYPQHAVIACWQGCGRALPDDPNYDQYDTRQGMQINVVNRVVDWVGAKYRVPFAGI